MKSTKNLKTALAGAVGLGSLLMCTMSWAPAAFAAGTTAVEVVKLDPALKYKESNAADRSADVDSFLADVIVKFASHDLYAIPMQGEKGPNILSLTRSDVAFGNASLDHLIFVKTGVKLSDEKANGKLLRMPKGVYGYHKVTKGGVPVAVIFTGFTEQEAIDAVDSVTVAANADVHPGSFVATVFNSLITSACAAGNPKDCLPESGASKGVKINAEALKSVVDKVMSDSVGATVARSMVECASAYAIGALWSTKPGMTVGTVALGAAAGVGLWEGAKALVNDWSGSVAKASDKVRQTAAVVTSTMKEIQAEAEKHDKGSWQKLLKAGEVGAEFACGIWGGLPKGALVKALNGQIDKLAIKEAFAKMASKGKFAKFFSEKAAAETAVAATAAEGAAKATAKAASSKTGAIAPVAAAEEAAPAAAKVADYSQKSAAPSVQSAVFKDALAQSGLKEAEAAPVLASVSKVASGSELASEDRVQLINAMRAMKPEQMKSFEAGVLKAFGTLPATANPATKMTAKTKIPLYRPEKTVEFKLAMEKEFKHAERAATVSSDPTQYPQLFKLSLKGEERAAVADVVVAAEERGVPVSKISTAIEDAGKVCAKE